MWLSFVIPLYNCEKYICTCLDSILNQGLEHDEYEVVVVNDGSTDDGASIVSGFCYRYNNFRLINKENGGVASARNRGIEEAKGEYIHFMDADDRLLPGGMRTLRDSILKGNPHVDMVTFWSRTVDRHYDSDEWEHIRPFKVLYKGTFLDYGNKYGFGWSSCLRIIQRDFLVKNNIRFKNYSIGEDVLFMMDVFTVTTATIVTTSLDIYRYCVREGSALTTVDNHRIKKSVYGYMGLFKAIRMMECRSPYRADVFEKEIEQFRYSAFIRLLSSSFSYKDIRRILYDAKAKKFYPIDNASKRMAGYINFIIRFPFLVFVLSKPFRHIFIPYIKPRIHRN